jgi:RNA polymerase sigma-70 factor (ECF subfamily)
MDQQLCQIELIRRAQLGDKQCLGQLAQQARERLRTYVYRLTQRDDLAQEIVQESLLEMCKVLGKLKKADRFWPWLYGIAINKLRRHYRTEQKQQRLAASSAKRKGTPKERQDGLENLVSEELKQIISAAMQKLRTRHKAVLIMRCYDEMTHSEIAESMGCSEFSTRMLFLSVTAAATKVGLLTGIVGLATTKTAIISFTAAGALTAGTIVAPSMLSKQDTEGLAPSVAISHVVSQFGRNSNADEQYWYYFPEGPAKPMMLRANSGAVGGNSERQILQDNQANYDFHDNTVHINNYRMWAEDLSVPMLPTDDPGLTDFLRKVQPGTRTVQHVASKSKNLLVIAARNEAEQSSRPLVMRHNNALEEDYFQSDWPATAKVFDNRDAMHKRGWTYFRVSGKVNGQNVFGTGRIPFVYATSEQYSPWLKLQVGSLMIVDTYTEAYLNRLQSEQFETYPGGSFFKGLTRPWMGLHTIDTVRRDAAEQRIAFETKHTPGSRFAQVELIYKGLRLIYKIDLEMDVIDEITFSTDQGIKGNLKFSYLQSIEGAGASEDFRPPRPRRRRASNSGPGLLWLVQLVEGSLG